MGVEALGPVADQTDHPLIPDALQRPGSQSGVMLRRAGIQQIKR